METVQYAKQSENNILTYAQSTRSLEAIRGKDQFFCIKSMSFLYTGLIVRTSFLLKHQRCPKGRLDKCRVTGLPSSGADVKQLTPLQDFTGAHRILVPF